MKLGISKRPPRRWKLPPWMWSRAHIGLGLTKTFTAEPRDWLNPLGTVMNHFIHFSRNEIRKQLFYLECLSNAVPINCSRGGPRAPRREAARACRRVNTHWQVCLHLKPLISSGEQESSGSSACMSGRDGVILSRQYYLRDMWLWRPPTGTGTPPLPRTVTVEQPQLGGVLFSRGGAGKNTSQPANYSNYKTRSLIWLTHKLVAL